MSNENCNKEVEEVVNAFVKKQESYGNKVSTNQQHNIKILAETLIDENNSTKPYVLNIPMGEGKSSLLVEYLKYMAEHDENFGCIVVKKTLDECNDLRKSVGLDRRRLPDVTLEISESENEDDYIVSVVRGFNFKECTKYVDKSIDDGWGTHHNAEDYDYRLCNSCTEFSCPVKISKSKSKKHRVIAITHSRLFFSADYNKLLQELMVFENAKGETCKRKLLIIDEKLDMVSVNTIKYCDFTRLKNIIVKKGKAEHIDLFKDIDNFLLDLDYPSNMKSDVLINNREYMGNLELLDEISEIIYNNKSAKMEDLDNFNSLWKILKSTNNTTSISFPDREKQVTNYGQVDIDNFSSMFDKTVILDATADIDLDYCHSNVNIVDGILPREQFITIYEPKNAMRTSKSAIAGTYSEINSNEDREKHYEDYIRKLTDEIAYMVNQNIKIGTLIVVYKKTDKKEFKKHVEEALVEKLKNVKFDVIHHGEYCTGVNHLSNYRNIIIVGQLNKSKTYYQNKSLALGLGIDAWEDIENNDYYIQNIQQIGRTAMRAGKPVNVFLLCDEPLMGEQLSSYFNATSKNFECTNFYREPKTSDRVTDIARKLLPNVGDSIEKRKVAEMADIKVDTLRKPYISEKLRDIGVMSHPNNNRLFLKAFLNN